MVSQSRDAEIIEVSQMESTEEVWADWLRQENTYAVGDRKAMEAGGGRYLNFIKIVLRKNKLMMFSLVSFACQFLLLKTG